ncbi:MAG: biopolymer transporter ExbD [Spirochaetia bacterium]|jgi:biopolymer transport protein ExbD|nr:biopolymer transporter ExbD [Spirochaetia bacterium]
MSSRRLVKKTGIDMTPLIDVILQLIIFFMITTTFRAAPGISLDLPGSRTAQSVSSTALSVVVMSENEIYVDKTRTSLEGLADTLKQRVAGSDSGSLRAVLEGRASASYQLIISVLDAFRMNGIENVGLITRKEKAVR